MSHLASRLLSLGLAFSALMALMGCVRADGEIHLIPSGFTGPVVLIYGVRGADSIEKEASGESVYRIGSDGLLVTSDSAPEPGWFGVRYYQLQEDGSRRPIPARGDRNELQVFAGVNGATGVEPNATRWEAYLVGVPNEREDWIVVRDRAADEAVARIRGSRH